MASRNIPDIFVDFVQIATSDVGIFLGLLAAAPLQSGLPDTDEESTMVGAPTELKAKVRFSQAGAKAFAILLKQALKEHEQQHGVIPLPPSFLQQVDVSADEW